MYLVDFQRGELDVAATEDMAVRRLFEAVKNHSHLEIKQLLAYGQLNVNGKNSKGENCLIEALRIEEDAKRDAMFKKLRRLGADVHNRDQTQRDALEWATKLGREKEALQLLKGPMAEYDFTHKDSEGLTALHHATINNLLRVVEVISKRLTRYKNTVDIRDSLGLTPYLHAKRLAHEHMARILLQNGASTNLSDTTTNRTSQDWYNEGMRCRREQELKKLNGSRLELRLNGKLSELKRKKGVTNYGIHALPELVERAAHTAEKYKSHTSGLIIDNSMEIRKMLQLKNGGERVKAYMPSTPLNNGSDRSSKGTGSKSSLQCDTPSLMSEIAGMLEIVSQNLTYGYCPPAKAPEKKPKRKVQMRVQNKCSSLATIMGKRHSKRSIHAPNAKSRCKSLHAVIL